MATRLGSVLAVFLVLAGPVSAARRGAGAGPAKAAAASKSTAALPHRTLGHLGGPAAIAAPVARTSRMHLGLNAAARGLTNTLGRLRLTLPNLGGGESEPGTPFADRMAKRVSESAGTFKFMGGVMLSIGAWVAYNTLSGHPFDPAPFNGMNVVISTLTVLQAPLLLMSATREARKDRARAEHDLEVNEHTETQVAELHSKVDSLSADVRRLTEALTARGVSTPPHPAE